MYQTIQFTGILWCGVKMRMTIVPSGGSRVTALFCKSLLTRSLLVRGNLFPLEEISKADFASEVVSGGIWPNRLLSLHLSCIGMILFWRTLTRSVFEVLLPTDHQNAMDG